MGKFWKKAGIAMLAGLSTMLVATAQAETPPGLLVVGQSIDDAVSFDPAEGFELTGRELAVLQLLAEGRTTRCTAHQLGCSPRTVEKHLERCFRKLDVRDRLNAVRVATQAGLVGHSQGADSPSLS